MKNTLRQLTCALGLCAALPLAATAASTPMKMSLWVPPAHPVVADLQAWAKSLEEASGGTIKPQLFPAQQLGRAGDHYDMARDGIVEFAMVAPGYTPSRFPIWNLLELPFSFSNSTTGARAVHEWYLKYAPQEMADAKVCLVSLHHPGVFHMRNAKVVEPKDLAGKRIRPAGPGMAQFITTLGGSTVQASLPEIRQLAERGVVDGVTFAWDILVIGADPVLKYHLDEPMYVTSQVYMLNPRFYDSLTPAQKQAVDSHCTPEWSERIAGRWAAQELAARDKLKAMPDHTVYTLNDAQRTAWREAAKPLTQPAYAAVQKRHGIDGAKPHQELLDTLTKYNARYAE